MIVEIHHHHPSLRRIAQAAALLERGEVVAYPTDTVYALGCDSTNKRAVEAIHRIKAAKHQTRVGPRAQRPVSLIVPDLSTIAEWAIVDDVAYRLLRRATPGPFTFILRATRKVPRVMLTKQKTIGIRVPDSEVALALCQALGRPLVTTSAAYPGGELIADAQDIAEASPRGVAMILDAGRLVPEPSTVIDLTGREPTVYRHGKGDPTAIGL